VFFETRRDKFVIDVGKLRHFTDLEFLSCHIEALNRVHTKNKYFSHGYNTHRHWG
jgi:hypothetical protein